MGCVDRSPFCEATVKETGLPCRNYRKGKSRWCVAHQDPASRGEGLGVAAGAAAVPSLASASNAAFGLGDDLAGFAAVAPSHPGTVKVVVAGSEMHLDRRSGTWRCATEPPIGAEPAEYQKAAEAALMAAAAAELLNAGMVDPNHIGVAVAHMEALVADDPCDETIDGALPLAFEAAALYALDLVAADLHQRHADHTDAGSVASRLLPDGFEAHDPLRNPEAGDYATICAERALRAVRSRRVEHATPLDRASMAAMSHGPVTVAARTGLGSVVGDLGVVVDLYEAHIVAGTPAYPTGLVVLSKAHQTAPESADYRQWVHKHIQIGENENPRTELAKAKPEVISGVLETVIYYEPDKDLAMRALKVLAEEAPEVFRSGIHYFYSWDLETEKRILAPFEDDPEMRKLLDDLLVEYREMASE